jgi:hypothetical protein
MTIKAARIASDTKLGVAYMAFIDIACIDIDCIIVEHLSVSLQATNINYHV